MNQQQRSGRFLAASVIAVAMILLASNCVSVWASVSADTEESAEFYPGRTGITIPDFNESLSQSDSGTAGVASVSYNYPYPTGGPDLNPSVGLPVDTVTADKGYSTYAYVNEPDGILRAYASTWLQVKGAMMPSIDINSHASADAEIYDTITLSKSATLLLAGKMDGLLGGSSSNPNYDVFERYIWAPMSVESWITFTYNVPGQESSRRQGFSAYYNSAGPASNVFSIPVDLPANTPIKVSAGLRITTAVDPDLAGILGVNWTQTVDPLTGVTGYIWADFASTMNFGIQVPDGVTVTSGSGLLPLQPATVPEPSALLALGSGLSLLAACFKRRH